MRVKLAQISVLNLRTDINFYVLHYHILIILRDQQYAVMGYKLKGYLLKNKTF